MQAAEVEAEGARRSALAKVSRVANTTVEISTNTIRQSTVLPIATHARRMHGMYVR